MPSIPSSRFLWSELLCRGQSAAWGLCTWMTSILMDGPWGMSRRLQRASRKAHAPHETGARRGDGFCIDITEFTWGCQPTVWARASPSIPKSFLYTTKCDRTIVTYPLLSSLSPFLPPSILPSPCVCLSVCVCVCVCVFGVFVWQSHYELQVLLELTILLSVPSRIWDCRCAPSHLAVFDSLTHFQVASELQIFLSFQFSLHCFPLSCDFWQATYPPCCSSLPYKTISLLPCCIWVFNVLN